MNRYLFLVFASLTLLLAACGGGPPPPPSSITLTVENATGNFDAAAYQVGSGPWQTLTMSGTTTKTATFNLGSESKYGVAVRCSNLTVQVIQATNSELANPKLVCSSPAPSTVSFTVDVNIASSLLAPGDQVCLNDASCQSAMASVSITANLEAGNRDLLITLKGSSGSVKVAKVQKGVNVSAGGSTTVSLGPADQLAIVSFSAPSAPAGYTASGGALVGYLSANNTASGFVNASPTSYRPVSGFSSGDRYGAVAFASATNAILLSYQFFSSGAPSLSFPAPWSSGSLTIQQTAHPSISGLARTENDLRGYVIYLQLPAQLYHTTVLSKGWLGSTTSYSLPNLSSQLGYTAPSGGSGNLEVSALLSNRAILSLSSADLAALGAGDYIRVAQVHTSSYTVGGGQTTLP